MARQTQTEDGDKYWNDTLRYPSSRVTVTCEEHPNGDILAYKTSRHTSWKQCCECGSLLEG